MESVGFRLPGVPRIHPTGSSISSRVSEIKHCATKDVERNSKGFGAKALIGSARSQIQRGQLEDAAGNSKAALHAFYIAATLATLAQKLVEGNKINHEFLHFYQAEMAALKRIKTLEKELLGLERSTSAESPHQDERLNVKVGNLVADRLKMLGQNGVIDPAKRNSRELMEIVDCRLPSVPRIHPTGSVIAHSLANGSAVTSTPIQYPTFSNTPSPHVYRPGGTALFSQPPTLPPQASINPSPLIRRRSSGTSAGSFSSRRPIDYPDLCTI